MNILVTGGAGFIGSNFCDLVLKQKEVNKLFIIDKFTYAGLEENLEHVMSDPRVQLIKADVCHTELFKEPLLDANYVFNFAAESHVDNSIMSPRDFIQTNIFGTFQILETLRQSNNLKKFVQISTDEVYGSLTNTALPSTELSPLQPSSPYSASKAGADHLALSYALTYGLSVTVTRSSNNYGPRQLPEKFIPKIIINALNGLNIPVYGTGKNIRDWIFVEDNCKGIWKAALSKETNKVFHFGADNELENLDIVKIFLEELNQKESLIEYVKDRPGHDFRYSLNIENTIKTLNWKPEESFHSGVKKTVNWYQKNLVWIDKANEKLRIKHLEMRQK